MSGTDEFGTGGYGTGDFDPAAAESVPGAPHRNPASPARGQAPGQGQIPGQNQGPAQGGAPGRPNQGAGAGQGANQGSNQGPVNSAPWLAGGAVPYAEAVFGGAGQGQGGPQQRPVGPGRRGAADQPPGQLGQSTEPVGMHPLRGQRPPGAGHPQQQPQAQQAHALAQGGQGYAEGYAPEGYVNGYGPGHGQAPSQAPSQAPGPAAEGRGPVPQQRYDSTPYDPAPRGPGYADSGFNEQQPGPYGPRDPLERSGYEQPAPRFEPGFEQQQFGSGQYAQAPYPVFDEPTAEFRPGPMFDEPTVRPAAPAGGPLPVQPPAQGAVNGRSQPSVFAPRLSGDGGDGASRPAAPDQGAGATQGPAAAGSGAWTAAPAEPSVQPVQPQPNAQQAGPVRPAAGQPNLAQQPPLGQAPSGQQPPQGQAPSGQPAPGPSLPGLQPAPSVSAIPRVPSPSPAASSQSLAAPPAAAANNPATGPGGDPGPMRAESPRRADGYGGAAIPPRPPLPDEPVPGPPPLPTRPPRAERQAQQAQAAQGVPQQTATPQTATPQTATPQATAPQQPTPPQAAVPPAQPSAPQVAAPQSAMQQVPPPQNAAQSTPSPASSAIRESLTPPRRSAAAPPQEQPPVRQQQQEPRQPEPQQTAHPPSSPRQAGQSQHVQGQPAQEQSANDLSSDRLRSVAPVPAPRAATPEPPAQPPAAQQPTAEQPAPRPTRSGSFGALLEEPEPNAGADDDADEMIVPWSAADQARAVAEAAAEAAGPEATQQAAPVQQESAAAQVSAPVQAAQTETPHPVQAQAQAPVQAQPSAQQAPSPSQAQAPFHDQAQVPAQSVTPGQVPAAAAVAANAPTPRGTRRRVAEPAAVASAGRGAVVAAAGTQASSGRAPVAAASRSAAPRPATGVRRTASASASVEPQVRSYQQPAAGPSAPALAAAAGSSAVRAASAAAAPDGRLRAPAYEDDALAAVYRVIHERRDVRNDFLSDEVPTETLTRILDAAHTAPSVGFSQPWDFLVIRDEAMRQSVHDLAARQRRAYAASLPKARARAFAAIKTEAILDTPVNIVVTCDPTRGGRYTLGRHTQPLMAPFSSCLAVENLWLAARAEGLGVGWVSFFDERELAAVLDLPDHLQVVAYLCVGYVASFPQEPELAGAGWAKRRPLAWAVHEERFGHRALPGAEPISLLNETVDAIRGLDPDAVGAARDRQARMTKPPGSLGALEAVSEQLAGLAGTCPPPLPEPAALAVFAGDHGVHAQGVTPWPQEVTAQMVANFLAGGAVVNAFAKQVGAEVCVVDVGVNADLKTQSGLIPRKVRYGTADMTEGPALTREEVVLAVEAGIETARDLVAAGNRCLLTGDMGIANTTASAALIAAFTGASPAQVTGYGTGIDEQTYAHKVEVVGRALALHQPDPQDPIGVLAAFGGLEHAALAGFILGASALRIPVVLDGVIAGAAALVAQALSPEVTAACVAGHRSAEPGHALALEALGITPLIDLELRLGEGSGAALALPLVGAAVRALREVATFDDAGVADASDAVVVPPTERERT